MAKILYSMKLGEVYKAGGDLTIMRVPGGWLYVIHSPSDRSNTSTFVPFNNEFQLVGEDF